RPLFVGVVILAIGMGVHELIKAGASRDIAMTRAPLYAAAVVSPVVAYIWGITAITVTFGVTVVLIFMWRIRGGTSGYVRDVTASVFVAAYLPFMAGFVMVMFAADNGPSRILAYVLLTILADIGGYAVGSLIGRHPLAPKISPKKSWEGFGGSLVVQAIGGVLLFVFLLNGLWWQGLVAGVVLAVTAMAGDLAESAIKRDLGVKDMGAVLPGHGGAMDRLDSLVPNAFVAWGLFTLFLGSGIS
ncbi:MAG: phosphatidate cytidylyltransferase, partial [Actinobacteria bacterium]|nr:phosphatidate cytidylyltransferase [Actinomycetota bacterium]